MSYFHFNAVLVILIIKKSSLATWLVLKQRNINIDGRSGTDMILLYSTTILISYLFLPAKKFDNWRELSSDSDESEYVPDLNLDETTDVEEEMYIDKEEVESLTGNFRI